MNSRCFVLTVIVVFALTCSVLAVVEDLSAAWGAYGYKRCLSRSKGKPNAPLAACTTFQELLEETMEQQGTQCSSSCCR
jgi:hypothetical protein